MGEQLTRGVKDVITDFPEVGHILKEFGVGCTTCAIGTCLLKDVVGIHSLSHAVEAELMYRIEKAIFPERDVKRPAVVDDSDQSTMPFQFSPPVQALVDEHAVIKRWLALIPRVVGHLESGSDEAWQWVAMGVELIVNYADRYHHAKEEDVLFKYADGSSDIIKIMHEEHRLGRAHRQAISDAISTKDASAAAKHLLAFRELLASHIQKEDEILYPWIDRGLSTRQVGEIFASFADADRESVDDPQKYLDFVAALEAKLL